MFFLDSTNLSDIDNILNRGLVSGVTTNPSLLMKSCPDTPLQHLKNIVKKMEIHSPSLTLSVQVMTPFHYEMREQALRLRDHLNYEPLVIKIPIGWDEIEIIYKLSKDGISINCTCCMTEMQVCLAVSAGARYASIFYGKTSDSGIDPQVLVHNSSLAMKAINSSGELIVGSLRTPWAITEAIRAGADIVTIPAEYFKRIISNDKTKEAKALFANDYPKQPWI